jgi:1-acyl-sn-glycerol-3-phosphate acyltransferase
VIGSREFSEKHNETAIAGERPAGRLGSFVVLIRSVAATLTITFGTLWDAYRGRASRAAGDRRLRWWSNRLLDLARMCWSVENPDGVEMPQGRPVILMSNHGSVYDIPLIFVALPGTIRMLTKKELFSVPVWGRGMAAGEFICIDRRNHEQALHDLEIAREKMESGIVLWVAPEGTRSRDGSLGEFKKGGFMLALQTGATIVPIGIRGARAALPPKTLLRLRYGVHATVHIGRPIDASEYGEARRDELIADVRSRIERLGDL